MKFEDIYKDVMKYRYIRQICDWKYKGDYEVYNMPTYEELVKNNYSITKKENWDNYICYVNNSELVAYVNMKEMSNDKIFMGIGLKPEYCGKGFGNYFLYDSIKEIKKRYPKHLICLEVRGFNKRAIKAYQNHGFVISGMENKLDNFGKSCDFVQMTLEGG